MMGRTRTGSDGSQRAGRVQRAPCALLGACLACAVLLDAWCVSYSAGRGVGSAFDELYWSVYDANVCGLVSLGRLDAVPALLSPFKYPGVAAMRRDGCLKGVRGGADYYSYGGDLSEATWARFKGSLLGVCDTSGRDGFDTSEGEWALSFGELSDSDEGLLYLAFHFEPRGASRDDPYVSVYYTFDLASKTLSAEVHNGGSSNREELLPAGEVKAMGDWYLFDVFLPAYFSCAGTGSAYSPGDLGDWGWGEVSVSQHAFIGFYKTFVFGATAW